MSEWNGLFTCQNFQLLHFNTARPCLPCSQTVFPNDLEGRTHDQRTRASHAFSVQHNSVDGNRVAIFIGPKSFLMPFTFAQAIFCFPLAQQTTPSVFGDRLRPGLKLVLHNPPIMPNYFRDHLRQGHCSHSESLQHGPVVFCCTEIIPQFHKHLLVLLG